MTPFVLPALVAAHTRRGQDLETRRGRLGLDAVVSPLRLRGMSAMLARIKRRLAG